MEPSTRPSIVPGITENVLEQPSSSLQPSLGHAPLGQAPLGQAPPNIRAALSPPVPIFFHPSRTTRTLLAPSMPSRAVPRVNGIVYQPVNVCRPFPRMRERVLQRVPLHQRRESRPFAAVAKKDVRRYSSDSDPFVDAGSPLRLLPRITTRDDNNNNAFGNRGALRLNITYDSSDEDEESTLLVLRRAHQGGLAHRHHHNNSEVSTLNLNGDENTTPLLPRPTRLGGLARRHRQNDSDVSTLDLNGNEKTTSVQTLGLLTPPMSSSPTISAPLGEASNIVYTVTEPEEPEEPEVPEELYHSAAAPKTHGIFCKLKKATKSLFVSKQLSNDTVTKCKHRFRKNNWCSKCDVPEMIAETYDLNGSGFVGG